MSPLIQANPLAASELQKHVLDHIKIKAEEDTEAELFAQYGVDPDGMISELQREATVALKVAQYMMEAKQLQSQLAGEGAPQMDPVVQLKQQELQQRAAKDAQDAKLKEQALMNEQMRIKENTDANDARIESQEKIAAERSAVARERIYAPRG